jgi:hypothetical protein
MTPPSVTIPLDDKRKRLGVWWQKLQHAVGGVPLLLAGVHRLESSGRADPLAIAEIVVAGALLVMLARDLRAEVAGRSSSSHAPAHSHGHPHAGPNWFDVVAGVMLIIESVQASHEGGKPFYARPNFLLGIVTLVIGLLHGRIARRAMKRREIHFDDSGIRARLGRFRSFAVPWSEIRNITITAKNAVIQTAAGSHTISFGRYRNAEQIRRALDEWRAAGTLPHSD